LSVDVQEGIHRMEKWKQHLGVYGVYTVGEKLLVVKKTRGPYINRYDLPGGSFDQNESINECLIRELKEEIGYSFVADKMIGTYDYLVPWEQNNNHTHIHHLAIYYQVVSKETIIEKDIVADDTAGFELINISELTQENSSPLVIDMVDYLSEKELVNSIKRYDNWKVLLSESF